MATKDYCALYANTSDPSYINDCALFINLPKLKRITETLSSNDSSSMLHKLFDICFYEALSQSFPTCSNDKTDFNPHKVFPNLFYQCVFTSLATIENFIFSNTSIHVNALLSMDYTPTDKYLSIFHVKTNATQTQLTIGKVENFYRNYKYASDYYNSVLNPSHEQFISCVSANFCRYLLNKTDAKGCNLISIKKTQKNLSEYVSKFNTFDTCDAEVSEKDFRSFHKLLCGFYDSYLNESEIFLRDLPQIKELLDSDVFLFLYKAMSFYQPDLLLFAQNLLNLFSVDDSIYLFDTTLRAGSLCTYQPFRTSFLSHYSNPQTPFSANTINEINSFSTSFLPLIQKLFFTQLLNVVYSQNTSEDTTFSAIKKLLSSYLSKTEIFEDMIKNWNNIAKELASIHSSTTQDYLHRCSYDALCLYTNYLSTFSLDNRHLPK